MRLPETAVVEAGREAVNLKKTIFEYLLAVPGPGLRPKPDPEKQLQG
jgi:hypothetical protein